MAGANARLSEGNERDSAASLTTLTAPSRCIDPANGRMLSTMNPLASVHDLFEVAIVGHYPKAQNVLADF